MIYYTSFSLNYYGYYYDIGRLLRNIQKRSVVCQTTPERQLWNKTGLLSLLMLKTWQIG